MSAASSTRRHRRHHPQSELQTDDSKVVPFPESKDDSSDDDLRSRLEADTDTDDVDSGVSSNVRQRPWPQLLSSSSMLPSLLVALVLIVGYAHAAAECMCKKKYGKVLLRVFLWLWCFRSSLSYPRGKGENVVFGMERLVLSVCPRSLV